MSASENDLLEGTAPVVGSGDFLHDMGYADPSETRAKFSLANRIALLIEDGGLKQAEVVRMTGLKQPDVSKIVNGNVRGFSVYRLLEVLGRLGQDVTISVEAAEGEAMEPLALAI